MRDIRRWTGTEWKTVNAGVGKKAASFVIGTSTSGHTAEEVDYLCDGVDDQVEFDAAIQALPYDGGEIVILDGVYQFTTGVKIDANIGNKQNVSIRGLGGAILERKFSGNMNIRGLINFVTTGGCSVTNLRFKGNRETYTGEDNMGVSIIAASRNTVDSCYFDSTDTGVYITNSASRYNIIRNNKFAFNNVCISINNACRNAVFDNICTGFYSKGIYLSGMQEGWNSVVNNICSPFNSLSGIGIVASYSKYNSIMGNLCEYCEEGIKIEESMGNLVSGNSCCNNKYSGIEVLFESPYNSISNNMCLNNDESGIKTNPDCDKLIITGNNCSGNNNSGILLASNNCSVSGNICTNNDADGIVLESASGNDVVGNNCNDNGLPESYASGIFLLASCNRNNIACNTCICGTGNPADYGNRYSIVLYDSSNNYNLISSNNCMGKAIIIGGGTGNTEVNNKYQ